MNSDRPIGVFRPTGVSVTVSGVLRRSTAAARCAAARAVTGLGLLTLIVPAAATASARILNDPEYDTAIALGLKGDVGISVLEGKSA